VCTGFNGPSLFVCRKRNESWKKQNFAEIEMDKSGLCSQSGHYYHFLISVNSRRHFWNNWRCLEGRICGKTLVLDVSKPTSVESHCDSSPISSAQFVDDPHLPQSLLGCGEVLLCTFHNLG
jgi:hypothetical protein